MPIINSNNDQNIKRFRTKMSERFPDECKTKLSKLADSVNYPEKIRTSGDNKTDLNLPYDHMYASNTENGNLINLTDANCQSAESEVKFWKEWLILHLDLIQQQSDEILSKERTIIILQQENEMLKERISCMERGAPFQPGKFFNGTYLDAAGLEMTQDSGPCDEDNKNCINLINLNCENGGGCAPVKKNCGSDGENVVNSDQFESQVNFKTDSEISTSVGLEFTVDSTGGEFDPMRNLRMSIRRKRLSNSSAVSNNDSVGDEKRPFRRFKKRRYLKDTQILTTPDQYVTETSKTNLRLTSVPDTTINISSDTNLEVPRWRVKVYASCYQMEGTENLDDEVYNKRHIRLENDERRRKRWDVQRIREQRLIEKLKQRQERMGSGSRTDEQNEPVQSLWPTIEDIKFLEVSDFLPVSAFGSPIPKVQPSEFSLPWLNNPSSLATKKVPAKRSTSRRKKR